MRFVVTLACVLVVLATLRRAPAAECPGLARIRAYIQRSWTALERSSLNAVQSAADSKVPAPGSTPGKVLLYTPRDLDPASVRREVERSLTPAEFAKTEIRRLPEDTRTIADQGLLYLPYPYVVPGGRFNEMYGWDSYFIVLGLVRDGEVRLAKNMADDLIFEIQHYGKVLNANRTYYLERSQPPFLTETILEVFRHTGDVEWLRASLPAIEKYYRYWTTEPHLTPVTGLSRYYSTADTPAPEVACCERDRQGRDEYDRVREYYRTHAVREYDLAHYYDAKHDRLTPLFYQGDRAMRESGFDPSARFGPFSVDIVNYNPVDLNCLLYRMEMDMAAILTILDQPREASEWFGRAGRRADAINHLMWNAQAGLYFDYNFARRQQSGYRFITTFYPLWAGLATPEQAAGVEGHLPVFERAGGLQTSDRVTGDQWDAPFGWAPMQVIATEGLRRYGYAAPADRIALKFLSMVSRAYKKHGTILEKYDVATGKADPSAGLKFGYQSDEIGFGWTNAAFLLLYEQLGDAAKKQLCQQ
jgi:alpha,alpha-trehalase